MEVKRKLEENRPHAFDRKVLLREMGKGEPQRERFYTTDQISLEDLDLAGLRTDMGLKGEDITSVPVEETQKINFNRKSQNTGDNI